MAAGVSEGRINIVTKIFYSEYMQKKRPKVPRFLCSGFINYLLRILSPSLCYLAGQDEKKSAIYNDFVNQSNKYLCYKRKLNKSEWKALYRKYRIKKRQQV